MSLTERHHVVVREIRKDRSAVTWWLKNRHRIRTLQPSAPFVFCRAIGIMTPGDVCVKAQHMVKALHVLDKIEQKMKPKTPVHQGLPSDLLAAFTCIHGYEGAWNANTGNGYYGGLQMDLTFQSEYGSEFVKEWGTANNWPPWAQLTAAERAHDGYNGFSARGFGPWPNTARYCGLI